ncbi:MAG: alpha/beta fold hydrolase [Pseudomonadota bacterium]
MTFLRLCFFFCVTFWAELGFSGNEDHYAEFQAAEVQPFYSSGYFDQLKLRDGKSLAYSVFENKLSDRAIVVMQGRTESMFKYAEWIYDLHRLGFTVFAFDFRGQGNSDHLVPSKPSYGHIDDFDTYVEDLREFLEKVVVPRHKGKLFLYAHSMGGAVAVMHELKYPNHFLGTVLQSPMLAIKTSPIPHFLAKWLVQFMVFMGYGESLPPTQKDEPDAHEKNTVTTSTIRREYSLAQRMKNKSAYIGPPTNLWVERAFAATEDFGSAAKKLTNSILMFQAGDDHFVINESLDHFCRSAKDCKSIMMSEGMHELYIERDQVRVEVLKKTSEYFQRF